MICSVGDHPSRQAIAKPKLGNGMFLTPQNILAVLCETHLLESLRRAPHVFAAHAMDVGTWLGFLG